MTAVCQHLADVLLVFVRPADVSLTRNTTHMLKAIFAHKPSLARDTHVFILRECKSESESGNGSARVNAEEAKASKHLRFDAEDKFLHILSDALDRCGGASGRQPHTLSSRLEVARKHVHVMGDTFAQDGDAGLRFGGGLEGSPLLPLQSIALKAVRSSLFNRVKTSLNALASDARSIVTRTKELLSLQEGVVRKIAIVKGRCRRFGMSVQGAIVTMWCLLLYNIMPGNYIFSIPPLSIVAGTFDLLLRLVNMDTGVLVAIVLAALTMSLHFVQWVVGVWADDLSPLMSEVEEKFFRRQLAHIETCVLAQENGLRRELEIQEERGGSATTEM